MLHPSFVEKRISQILDHLTFTKEYIYNYSVFESPKFKKRLEDEQVATVYIEYIFENNFDLIKLFEFLHDEVEFLANVLDENGLKVMFGGLKKCKKSILEKCNKGEILESIASYNTDQLRMEKIMKMEGEIFDPKIIEVKNLDKYFEVLDKMKAAFSDQMDQLLSKYDKGRIRTKVIGHVIKQKYDCKYQLDKLCTDIKWIKEESRNRLGVKKNNPDYFKITDKGLEKLEEFLAALKRYELIEDINMPQFKKHFQKPYKKEVRQKIKWLETNTSLRYFIIQLFPFVENAKSEIWAVAINCFMDKDGNSFQAAALSGTKAMVSKKVDRYVDHILEVFTDDCIYPDRERKQGFKLSKRTRYSDDEEAID